MAIVRKRVPRLPQYFRGKDGLDPPLVQTGSTYFILYMCSEFTD